LKQLNRQIVAYLCACAERKVNLFDCSRSALEQALSRLGEWARRDFGDLLAAETVLQRVETAPSLEAALTGVSIVVEALSEHLELKQKIFAQLDTLCPPDVILASNSSCLRMSRIETEVQDRGRVANMHFLHPPMKPVEIMAGSATLAQTLEQLRRFAVSLGLRPFVLRQESTGFLFNRIWRAIKRDVLHEVAEGVASPEDIDRITMLVWNWGRGPFGWMDIVGLDVVRSIEDMKSKASLSIIHQGITSEFVPHYHGSGLFKEMS
jgi:3-hydroxybutyryl-CoA dehydrogenase